MRVENGATGVASWRVLGETGPRARRWQKNAIPDSGSKSSTTMPKSFAYVAVQELGAASACARQLEAVKDDRFLRRAVQSNGDEMMRSPPAAGCRSRQ